MDKNAEQKQNIKLRELIQSYCEVPEQMGDEAPGRWFFATEEILKEIIAVSKNGVTSGKGRGRGATRKLKRRY
jgi:hypothetical protein